MMACVVDVWRLRLPPWSAWSVCCGRCCFGPVSAQSPFTILFFPFWSGYHGVNMLHGGHMLHARSTHTSSIPTPSAHTVADTATGEL